MTPKISPKTMRRLDALIAEDMRRNPKLQKAVKEAQEFAADWFDLRTELEIQEEEKEFFRKYI